MKRKNLPLVIGFCGVLIGLHIAFWLLPKESFSENEKRVLQETPQFSWSNLWNGKWFATIDEYISDHFPKRDFWVGLHAYANQGEGLNAAGEVYQGKDGWLIQAPVKPGTVWEQNLQTLKDFLERHPEQIFTFLCIPTTGAVVQDKLPGLHDDYPDKDLLIQMKKKLQNHAQWIDIMSAFEQTETDDLYYRTDHHWTSQGAYLAYQILAQAWDFTPADRNCYIVEKFNGFYGTTYSKSGLWATESDIISLWTDKDTQIHVAAYDENRPTPVVQEGAFFLEHLNDVDKYPVFLDGNHARVTLTSNAPDGKLLIVRDSFAHCFAPFLSRHFQTIDLVDLRYFKSQTISELMEQNHYDRVLFVYGLETVVDDRSIQWLE